MDKLFAMLNVSIGVLVLLVILYFSKNNLIEDIRDNYKNKTNQNEQVELLNQKRENIDNKQIEPKNETEKKIKKQFENEILVNQLDLKNTAISSNGETLKKADNKKKKELIIETAGRIKQKDIELLQEEINNTIPEWLLNSFISNGWIIKLTTEDIGKVYLGGQYGRVMAVTEYHNKRIIIEKRAIKTCVAHEFGHFLEFTCTYPVSNSEEFQEIYRQEVKLFKSKIESDGCVFNACEFFAEEYYYSRKDSSKCTKKALEFIEKISKYYEEGAHI